MVLSKIEIAFYPGVIERIKEKCVGDAVLHSVAESVQWARNGLYASIATAAITEATKAMCSEGSTAEFVFRTLTIVNLSCAGVAAGQLYTNVSYLLECGINRFY